MKSFFDVLKLQGKKTREIFYCEKCGALLNGQSEFTTEDEQWTCTECSEWNDVSDNNIIYEE